MPEHTRAGTRKQTRKHRRVTAYSRVDQERLAAGKEPLAAEPELIRDEEVAAFNSNDERLLRDVPPHYGG